jgi:uncharacterized protein YkwD
LKKIMLLALVTATVFISCQQFDNLIKSLEAEQKKEAGLDDPHFSTFTDPVKFKKTPAQGNCFEGELAAETKTNVLNFLNYIRELHGLQPVVYSAKDDIAAQKGAFIIAVNGGLTHDPPKSWKCWSKEGHSGCSTSNIIGGTNAPFTPCEAVRYWLIDAGTEGLGHRRWLLDPFLKTIAYGHVETSGRYGATLKVIGNEEQAAAVDYVAYPYHEYPALLIDMNWYLSFSVVQDRKNAWNNGSVDFSSAAVTMTAESGNKLKVTAVAHDNQGFGVPNLLVWKVKGLEKGTRYTVNVRNVKTGTGKRDYEYWFMVK